MIQKKDSSSVFCEYVTSSAFHLSLSRRQIEALCMLEQFGSSWAGAATFNALLGKGLAERLSVDEDGERFPRVRITEAGKAVMPLLRLAGLYVEFPKYEVVEQPEIVIDIKRKQPIGEEQ